MKEMPMDKTQEIVDEYLKTHNIYEHQSLHINVSEVLKYASSVGKLVAELSEEEVERFKVP